MEADPAPIVCARAAARGLLWPLLNDFAPVCWCAPQAQLAPFPVVFSRVTPDNKLKIVRALQKYESSAWCPQLPMMPVVAFEACALFRSECPVAGLITRCCSALLCRRGDIVAMTGDGVNDAAAIRVRPLSLS